MRGVLGLGSRSTAWFLNQINLEYNKIHGGYSTCPLILLNTDFDNINPYLPNQFEKFVPYLEKELSKLMNLGAKKILLPNITLHEAFEHIDRDYPIINPTNLIKELKEEINDKPNIILGTSYTMKEGYLNKVISTLGGETYNLSPEESSRIDQVRKDIYSTGVSTSITEKFNAFLEEKQTCNVFIACTELSLIPCKKGVTDLSIKMIKEFVK